MESTIQLTELDRKRVEAIRSRHKTGVLTLVFTDIVDSTRLKRDLGEVTGYALIVMHQEVVRKLLAQFPEAEEITTAGDSFFLIFIRPSDAVRFALLLHAQLRKLATTIPRPLVVRIGIHMGEVIIERDLMTSLVRDILGMQVDVAHRVMSLAGGNQTLLTRSVFENAHAVLRGEELGDLHPILWMNHGLYQIKGLEEPRDICEVGEEGFAPLSPPADSEKAHRYISPDIESGTLIPRSKKQRIYQPEESGISPIIFLEAGLETVAVVLKESCSLGRLIQNSDIEIPVIDPITKRRDREKVEKISRCHFQLKYSDDKFYLIDSSSHGTYINETKIHKSTRYPLKNNDRIQLVKEKDTWVVSYLYREFKSQQIGKMNAIRLQQLMNASPRAIVFLLREATVGSTEADPIYFPSNSIKPEHARIFREEDKLWIEPIHGEVLVNNHPVGKQEIMQLCDGLEINLSGQIIKVNPQQTRFWKTMETETSAL